MSQYSKASIAVGLLMCFGLGIIPFVRRTKEMLDHDVIAHVMIQPVRAEHACEEFGRVEVFSTIWPVIVNRVEANERNCALNHWRIAN